MLDRRFREFYRLIELKLIEKVIDMYQRNHWEN